MFNLEKFLSISADNAEVVLDALVKRIEDLERTNGYLQRQNEAKDCEIARLNDTNRQLCEEIAAAIAKNGG